MTAKFPEIFEVIPSFPSAKSHVLGHVHFSMGHPQENLFDGRTAQTLRSVLAHPVAELLGE